LYTNHHPNQILPQIFLRRRKLTMKKIHIFISLMILAAFVLGACGPAATPEPTQAPPTEAPMEEPTEAPMEEPTEAPMEEPTEEPAMELPDLGGRVITVAIENAYLPFNYVPWTLARQRAGTTTS
jgi:ABC-type amino acid transport substrate-binding protein